MQIFTPAPGIQPLYRTMHWFRGGLVFEAQTLLYHSTIGLRVIKKTRRRSRVKPSGMQIFTPAPGIQPLYRTVQWFRDELDFEAHRLVCHSA